MSPSSATHLIHSTDHGSTVFIHDFREFLVGFTDRSADPTFSLGVSGTTDRSADPTSLDTTGHTADLTFPLPLE